MALKDKINEILCNIGRVCYASDRSEAAQPVLEIYQEVERMKKRLDEPLRIAVVGIMKAGKSTLMNAIMGQNVVCTGSLETTYTVSWFRYGEDAHLEIVFKDGTSQKDTFENLERWSVRQYEAENPKINQVKYLIVYYPSEILKSLEFIDTPGLNSSYQLDAQNTLDFLGVKSKEEAQALEDTTIRESSNADAILYAFNHSVGSEDKTLLDSFHNSSESIHSSPINSIGVLTKIDLTGAWNVNCDETPTKLSQPVAATMMEKPVIKRLLFNVLPVTAKAVEEFDRLTTEEQDLLTELSKLTLEDRKDLLFDATYFVNESDDDELAEKINLSTRKTRKSLMDKLGLFGICNCAKHLQGKCMADVLQSLKEDCGIIAVEETLKNHFGNRALLIKSQYILSNLYGFVSDMEKKYGANSRIINTCKLIKDTIEDFETNDHTRKELQVLQAYYNGELAFSPEETEDFLAITGEYGSFVEKKLQVEHNCSLATMRDMARKKIRCLER